MRKATIDNLNQGDHLALLYMNKGQPGTLFEIIVTTSTEVGGRVKLPQLSAERKVVKSRWGEYLKVVHFSAIDWLRLRGAATATDAQLNDARQLTIDEKITNPSKKQKQQRPRREEGVSSSDRKG